MIGIFPGLKVVVPEVCYSYEHNDRYELAEYEWGVARPAENQKISRMERELKSARVLFDRH